MADDECMDPNCHEAATASFVSSKTGRDDQTFWTCSAHKMPVSFGLIRFGLAECIVYDRETADA